MQMLSSTSSSLTLSSLTSSSLTSSSLSTVNFLTPDFPTNPTLALLDPTLVDYNDPRAFKYYEDVDSILVATTSLEPFHCYMYAVLVHFRNGFFGATTES